MSTMFAKSGLHGDHSRPGQVAQAVGLLDRGRSVFVRGASGLGRTTFVREVTAALSVKTVWLMASVGSQSIPLGALAGVLRSRGVDSRGVDSQGDGLANAVSELRGLSGLIVADDAHLLDDVSASVLHHATVERPIFATVDTNAVAPDAIRRLGRDHAVTIDLAPLGISELTMIAEQALDALLAADASAWLCDVSAGNPQHLLDLIRANQTTKNLFLRGGVWCTAATASRQLQFGRPAKLQLDDRLEQAARALRHGDPDAAARSLATVANASDVELAEHGLADETRDLAAARLRWALAWAGRIQPVAPTSHDSRLGMPTLEQRLAECLALAELGESRASYELATFVAECGERISNFVVATEAHHLRARLRMSDSGSMQTVRSSIEARTALAAARAEHVAGLVRGDGPRLGRAAVSFEGLDERALAHEAFLQAAFAYVSKGATRAAGRCQAEAQRLAEHGLRPTFAARQSKACLPTLTRREREVASQAAADKSLREIGEVLGCSPRTAEAHLQRAYIKLGVNNRHNLRRLLASA